jgi:hypothetical protein
MIIYRPKTAAYGVKIVVWQETSETNIDTTE